MFVLGISHNTFPLWFFFWRGGVYHTICFLFFHCHLMYLTHLPTQTAHFALHNPPQLVLPHSSIKPTMLNTALLPPYQMPSFWTTPFKIPEYDPPKPLAMSHLPDLVLFTFHLGYLDSSLTPASGSPLPQCKYRKQKSLSNEKTRIELPD